MKIIAKSDLKKSASTIKEIIDNISTDIKHIQSLSSSIPQVWNGKDAESMMTKYNEIVMNLNTYKKNIDNYCVFLNGVYDVFNLIDEYYDKDIS